MVRTPQVLDQWGRPLRRSILTQEVAAPTLGGVRRPDAGYAADGLDPARLALILREADAGDPLRAMELAEAIEERDPHYSGVLRTRKLAVSQLDLTVEPADETARANEIAERFRTWVKRLELQGELFDILDSVGKGYSFTEIIWDRSMGQWEPARLEYRDPRWFRFSRHDLTTPMMLDDHGAEMPLPAFKFIHARIKAKSGLPLRSGLARVVAWTWMFKAFAQRDWSIFTQTYGQPLRIGKYGPGTSEEDRMKLFHAVANIAGDCAAIVPESMMMEFVQAANVSGSVDLYERRCDWLDRQTSKAILGQTATTDAVTGGLGSGKEHREVQEDIERADAGALSAVLTRQLAWPWVQLEFGADAPCPTIKVARPETEDLSALSSALSPLIAQGLRVRQDEVLAKFGLSEPGENDVIIGQNQPQTPPNAPQEQSQASAGDGNSSESKIKYRLNTHLDGSWGIAAQSEEGLSTGLSGAHAPERDLAARLEVEGAAAIGGMIKRVEAMAEAASSLEELREMLNAGFADLDESALAALLARAALAGQLGGRAMVEDEANG